ncbi:MAG TPA: hypothetical protein DCY25_12440, partial [Bacteroidales bacterium]|nr:hypothetical protein [Bacteroidales bacterium]
MAASVARTSTDFKPEVPRTHGLHIWINSHTSYWMGEVVLPDWDMFQSGLEGGASTFHAAARAISGGPVYCTDECGKEDFDILRKLSLSDGTIPLCCGYARLCRDSLFVDPGTDCKPVKIFNTNPAGSGVIGVFNCCWQEGGNRKVQGTVSP